MTSITDTLRSIEERAERAIVQELRLMKQEILAFRTLLVLDERCHADGLLLKLDRLEQEQMVPLATSENLPAMLMPDLVLGDIEAIEPVTYKVHFYDRAYGDLQDVVTVDTFEQGVQLILDRVDAHRGHAFEGDWVAGLGTLKVMNVTGTVLATVESSTEDDVEVDPMVHMACLALERGDASRLAQLFGRTLKVA